MRYSMKNLKYIPVRTFGARIVYREKGGESPSVY
jgi:hypothetical protein